MSDRNTKRTMTPTRIMDTRFTTLKSRSVILIRSCVQGASPISIPLLSYLFRISLIVSHCAFTSSVATLYSERMNISLYSPLSRIFVRFFGIISFGNSGPRMESNPTTALLRPPASLHPQICSPAWSPACCPSGSDGWIHFELLFQLLICHDTGQVLRK